MRWSRRWRAGLALRRIPFMWVLVVVLLVALMIPITAILLDSPLGRSFARRLDGQGDGGGAGGGAGVRKLEQRVEALETDLEDLNRSIAGIREELQFVQSEEHTSELQSQSNLVCRLLLEKKRKRE